MVLTGSSAVRFDQGTRSSAPRAPFLPVLEGTPLTVCSSGATLSGAQVGSGPMPPTPSWTLGSVQAMLGSEAPSSLPRAPLLLGFCCAGTAMRGAQLGAPGRARRLCCRALPSAAQAREEGKRSQDWALPHAAWQSPRWARPRLACVWV